MACWPGYGPTCSVGARICPHPAVQVRARVQCTAHGMWAVAGAIEKAMIEQAQESTSSWLLFCQQYCSNKLKSSKVGHKPRLWIGCCGT